MNIRQNIRDFCAKFFSKYFWRELWLDIRAFPRKRVNAKTLKRICECINPSYSLMVKRAYHKLGSARWAAGPGDLFNHPGAVEAFYNDRENFLEVIADHIPSSLHEYLKEKYSPAKEKEKLDELIGRKLRKNILLSNILESEKKSPLLWFKEMGTDVRYRGFPNTPEVRKMHQRKAVEFANLVVEGRVNLNLCGRFDRWKFDSVKFLNGVLISVRPPFKILGSGGLTISDSFFGGSFDCHFVGVPRIHICNSKFIAPINMRIKDAENAPVPIIRKLIRDMTRSYLKDSSVPVIEFSGNRLESINLPHAINDTRYNYPDLGKIRFVNGNHIGSLPMSLNTYPRGEPMNVNKKPVVPLGADVKFSDIHFSVQERIKKQSSLEMTLNHKEYFIALKNQAIDQRDREAEFNHGRQERYFDRLLATRWQDKFIFGWSHYVSDSGISWIRPIVILFCGQGILAAIFIGGLCECGDYVVWFRAAVESLNPLNSLSDIIKSPDCEEGWVDSLAASIYGEVRRIFTLALYYEIIKTFRHFYN